MPISCVSRSASLSACVFIVCVQFLPYDTANAEDIACNCVKWVRQNKVPSLPTGLCTLEDKKKIIRSQTPRVGSVAIIDPHFLSKKGDDCDGKLLKVGTSIGHVAYVKGVKKKKGKQDVITIEEANYKKCKISPRTGTKAELQIIGFYP